jgi:hypothetical protein
LVADIGNVKRFLTRIVAALALLGPVVAAPATASAATSGDPAVNRTLSHNTLWSCHDDPSASACISSALADIDAARAAEGVRAMVLPGNFASMSVPVQLLNLANLERVDRGLAPILGLSASLDGDAQAAAAQDRDPMPTHFYGDMMTSNWAGGDASALEADFEWMYDDGPGSGNLDCTSSYRSGCWGHRHDILWHFSAPIVMGAGYGTGQYGPSMTELFVGGDTRTGAGQPDAPIAKPATGGTAAAAGANHPPAARLMSLVPAGSTVNLTVGCTGTRGTLCRMTVTLALGRGRHAQALAVAVIAVAAGHSRTITVRLDRPGRRLLAARHKLRVQVLLRQAHVRRLLARVVTLTA